MRYRRFGRTGLEVSELVFGGGWVGGVLIHQDDATKLATLRRALEAGINWIDTAPSYGNTQSEQALGWLLQEVGGEPHLSTKVLLDTAGLDDIAGQVERSVHASLQRLRRHAQELPAAKAGRPGDDRRPRQKPQDAEHADALAGPGFADDAENTARLQVHVYAGHRLDRTAAGREADAQVADRE